MQLFGATERGRHENANLLSLILRCAIESSVPVYRRPPGRMRV